MIAGAIVQIVSIICPSRMNRNLIRSHVSQMLHTPSPYSVIRTLLSSTPISTYKTTSNVHFTYIHKLFRQYNMFRPTGHLLGCRLIKRDYIQRQLRTLPTITDNGKGHKPKP